MLVLETHCRNTRRKYKPAPQILLIAVPYHIVFLSRQGKTLGHRVHQMARNWLTNHRGIDRTGHSSIILGSAIGGWIQNGWIDGWMGTLLGFLHSGDELGGIFALFAEPSRSANSIWLQTSMETSLCCAQGPHALKTRGDFDCKHVVIDICWPSKPW